MFCCILELRCDFEALQRRSIDAGLEDGLDGDTHILVLCVHYFSEIRVIGDPRAGKKALVSPAASGRRQ